MADDFNFGGGKEEKGVEATLDDFFQPTEVETTAKKPAKPAAKEAKPAPKETKPTGKEAKPAAPKKEDVQLPIEKNRVADLPEELPSEPEVKEEEAPAPKEETKKDKKKAKRGKKAKGSSEGNKTLKILLLVALLLVVLLAAAGYLAFSMFPYKFEEVTANIPFIGNKPEEIPAPAPTPKPTPPLETPAQPPATAQPAPTPGKPPVAKPPAATPVKPEPGKPAPVAPATVGKPAPGKQPPPATSPVAKPAPATPAAKPEPIAVKPVPSTSKPTTPPAPAKPAPAPTPGKPPAAPVKPVPVKPPAPAPAAISLPSYAPGKGWSCQVGAYMLKESLDEVLVEIKPLGYTNLYYIDMKQNLRIYHLRLKGDFDLNTANAKKKALEQIGFKPRLEQNGSLYRVLAYSYGNNAVALKSKRKIEQEKLGPAEISSKRETVTLHQLRIGAYPARADAAKVLQALRQKGFSPALVEEK